MAAIELEGVAHHYGAEAGADPEWALDGLSHRFEDGTAVAVLGPSGCGKTTLLKVVSGLLQPTRGRVTIDGRDVTPLPPRERHITQVFQFPVVYDSMTVEGNLDFPLRNRGVPEAERRARVREVAELLDLTALLPRRARGLSASLRQTVSLARGLVRPDAAALLLDEPLTVIDPGRRWEIRQKLKRVHAESALTLVYVTHDQTEALTFADLVVVMDAGRILQVGTPRELFETPAHRFVGHFIGSPGMNLLPCHLEGRAAVVDDLRIPLGAAADRAAGSRGTLELGVRPEYLELRTDPAAETVPVRVQAVAELGDHRIVTALLAGRSLKVRVPDGATLPSERAHLHFPPERICLYREGKLVS